MPVTVKRISDGNITINFKGFAVGDPCGFETIKYFDSDMWYEYYHGWISEQNWNKMLYECCEINKTYIHQNCHFGNPQNLKCAELVADATKIIKDASINWNDWIVDCYRNHNVTNYAQYGQYQRLMQILFNRVTEKNKFFKKIGLNDQVYTVCGNTNGAYNYLNRMDVRNAIHVNRSIVNKIEWNICSDNLDYNVLEIYDNEHWLYKDILNNYNNDIYIMVYNGDVDAGINILVSQWFVDNFSLPIIKDYGQWYIDQQVGGWSIYYDRISFVTIRGAGHEVPKYRPQESLKMEVIKVKFEVDTSNLPN